MVGSHDNVNLLVSTLLSDILPCTGAFQSCLSANTNILLEPNITDILTYDINIHINVAIYSVILIQDCLHGQ